MKKLLLVFMAVTMFSCVSTEDTEPIIQETILEKPGEVTENKEQGVRIQTLLDGIPLTMNYVLYSEWDSISNYDMKTEFSAFFKSDKNKKLMILEDQTDLTLNLEAGKYLLQVGQFPPPYMFSLIEFEVKKDEIITLKKDFGGNTFDNPNSSNYVKW